MNESTLVLREEMSDLDWLARNVHAWAEGKREVLVCWPRNVDALIWSCVLSDTGWITKDQWLARRAELQNKPSWGSVGSDINFISQHEDGQWIGHSEKPEEGGECFECDCEIAYYGYGEVIGDWRYTLEKRPEKTIVDICGEVTQEDRHEQIFEPFVSAEEAAAAKQAAITPSKYSKTIRGVSVDVYDVLQAWSVSNPALQHLIKKALQCGQRGHKDNAQDLQDIIDSAIRAKELES